MNRAKLVLHAKASIDRGSKSFALASKLFANQPRERVWMLYAWCRQCDDLADGQEHGHGMSATPASEKTIALMRMLTRRAMGGEQTGKPAFDAMGVVAQECRLPNDLADDVIDGFALDAKKWRPQSENDLYQYCYHVAGAVGCMMAIVMGVSPRDHETLDRACDLGLAFQLSNIARDVAEDAAAGRCYLPADWLAEMRIDPDDIMNPARRDALVQLVARLCDLAEQYEASARVGAAQLPFRSRWAILAAAGIYGDIARAVRRSNGGSLDQRIITSKAAKVRWILKAFHQSTLPTRAVSRVGLWQRHSKKKVQASYNEIHADICSITKSYLKKNEEIDPNALTLTETSMDEEDWHLDYIQEIEAKYSICLDPILLTGEVNRVGLIKKSEQSVARDLTVNEIVDFIFKSKSKN